MQKRVLGYLLAALGLGGMILAGYLFATGTGGRVNLLEVTSYMIAGATCFFTGLNYIYESATAFTRRHLEAAPELEEVPPIQQQWRTIQITAKTPARSEVSTAAVQATSATV